MLLYFHTEYSIFYHCSSTQEKTLYVKKIVYIPNSLNESKMRSIVLNELFLYLKRKIAIRDEYIEVFEIQKCRLRLSEIEKFLVPR